MTQDIKITPRTGETTGSGAQIFFRGSGTITTGPSAVKGTPTSGIELNVMPDSDLSFAGYQGELFNISPQLQSGTIFAVKDISGIDHISVNASGDVNLNQFYGDTFVFNLPTADPTNSGQLWRDGTDLKVSEG